MAYTPPPEILDRYASVLVDYALGGGSGIERGDVVRVTSPESARPLYEALLKAVWRSGGHVIGGYYPDGEQRGGGSRDFFELAGEEQIDHFPARYMRGLIDEMDHQISVIADRDPQALEGVDPARIMRRGEALRPLMDWRAEKENEGRFSWTLGLYGTPAMAAEAGLGEQEYWEQIVHACFLDEQDPIARWREVGRQLEETRAKLDSLEIERVQVQGEDVELTIVLGEQRRWLGGRGRNIPSFEIFTSPDWRGTEGWIRFNQPLYHYGNLVRDVRLAFSEGRVVEASAEQNEPILREMIATKNADRVGEFSLTDKRFSRITRFMAQTLFDENMGGPFGNTHIALGRSYQDAYEGDPAGVSEAEWERLGFNTSSVHTDIVSTSDRVVTATLRDGSERVIYSDGEFQLG
ncbi:MAG TPA: aminopeptidase [Solirubrobacteraceae bacterium]